MSLPTPSPAYSQSNEAQTRSQIDRRLNACRQAGDVVVAPKERVILYASDGSRWALVVSPTGVLSTVAA